MRLRTVVAIAGLALIALLAWIGSGLRMELPAEPELPGRLESRSFEHGSRERSVHFYVPAGLAARPALVVVFHGSMGDGAQARAGFSYDWDRLAERHGFLVAYPDGFERHWNGCRAAGPYQANRQDVDDVGFARRVVDVASGLADLDRRRVFATGISNGGHMVLRLALEAPDAFRAVAPVIAAQPAPENLDCEPAGRPVSIAFLNGTEDPMNPYEGGTVALYGVWGNRGDVLSTPDSAAYWRDLAGHEGPGARRWLDDTDPEDGTRIEEISWQAPSRPLVLLLAVHGGGHTVPHPDHAWPRLLGRTSRDHRAAQLVWDFFVEAP